MSDILALFQEEARVLDPLWMKVTGPGGLLEPTSTRPVIDLDLGGARRDAKVIQAQDYVNRATNWRSRVQPALMAAGAQLDPLYRGLFERFTLTLRRIAQVEGTGINVAPGSPLFGNFPDVNIELGVGAALVVLAVILFARD